MKTYRDAHTGQFTMIANATVRDKGISWAARGVLSFLLSMPANWEFTEEEVILRGNLGRDAIRTIMSELEAAGYVRRTPFNDEKGHLKTLHEAAERPSLMPAEPEIGKGKVRKSAVAKPAQVEDEALKAIRNTVYGACCILPGHSTKGQIITANKLALLCAKNGWGVYFIEEVYDLWKVHDFRGQRGEIPTLEQLQTRMAQVAAGSWPPKKEEIKPANSRDKILGLLNA